MSKLLKDKSAEKLLRIFRWFDRPGPGLIATFAGPAVARAGGKKKLQTIPPTEKLVIVSEANVSTSGPKIQLVKDVDSTGAGVGDAFPAVSLCKMATGDQFYVFKPRNGLKGQPKYTTGTGTDAKTEDVVWRDVRQPGPLSDFTLVASGGTSGSNPMDRTYNIKLFGYSTVISASPQSPLIRFQAGRLSDATRGQGPIDDDGVPTLHIAYEGVYGAGDCGA